MLKPMIDQMQQGAMAQYGDWGGVGVAAKPNLPPINARYDVAIDGDADDGGPSGGGQGAPSEPLSGSVNDDEAPSAAVSGKRIEIGEVDCSRSLVAVLEEHCSPQKDGGAELKVFGHELTAKMTADALNGKLYAAMILRNAEMDNERQRQSVEELVTLLDRMAAAKRKGLQLKLSVTEGAFEILDELLLMTEPAALFPAVSLLRLLLVLGAVRRRYAADFMIIHQILYKIGIPFEEELGDEDAAEEKADGHTAEEEQEEMNLLDLHLLQFTAISAVSHLYHGQGALTEVDPTFINLGINALRIRNCNVRLSAARLLFNICCELKRRYILDKEDSTSLMAEMERVCGAALRYSRREKHVPTVYRLLCILGMCCYFDDGVIRKKMGLTAETINEWKGVHDACEAITASHDDIKSMVVDK